MEKEDLIPVDTFCASHNIQYTFVQTLQDRGLVEITHLEHQQFIPAGQLRPLEQYTRMHYEMDINVEGIEAIAGMLERIEKLQQEITRLKNTLRLRMQSDGDKFEDASF